MSDPGGSHSCFPANPDVSGIGVRSAIYAQNLLSFAPALLALKDRKVTPTELDALERQSTTILITAFAILVTTIIQTRTNGISNYHASIVLELSWMNNTNLFIYLLLYTYRRVNLFDDELNEEARSNLQAKSQLARWIYEAKKAVTNPVIIIGSLHLSLMAAVGMWLWSQPAHFGNSLLPCSLSASVVIVGNAVPLGSPQLRAWSILIYSILLVPFLNLIIPIAFFAIPLILYNRKKRVRLQRVVFGLGILGVIDAILLVDTEIGIKKNTEKFLLGHDEGQWTFGQILALLLLLVPLRDLGESILERRGRSLGKRLEAASTDGEEELVRYMLGLGVNRDTLNSSLRNAAEKGHMGIVQLLLLHDPDANDKDVNGNSALILAAKKQHEDIIKILLGIYKTDKEWNENVLLVMLERNRQDLATIFIQHGYNLTKRHSWKKLLHAAVGKGNVEIVKYLIEKYREIGKTALYLSTVLHIATQAENMELVTYFITLGADMNLQDHNGSTALHYAAKNDNTNLIKHLVDNDANINIQDQQGATALHYSAQAGNTEMLEYLIEHKANVNFEWKSGETRTVLHYFARHGNIDIIKYLVKHSDVKIGMHDIEDRTVLHWAAKSGCIDVVKYLVEVCQCKAYAHIKDSKKGRTPLYYGIRAGSLEVVSYLVEVCKTEINVQDTHKKYTPLHHGVKHGSMEVVRYLVEVGKANPNAQGNTWRRTPLHIAALKGKLEILQYLIEACRSDANVKDCLGYTSLHIGALGGSLDVVRYLVEVCNTDIYAQSTDKQIATHCGAQGGSLDVVKYLVETCQVDPHIQCAYKRTLLHYSARTSRCFQLVKWLVESCKADVHAKDENQETPLELASDIRVVKYLKSFA